MILVSITQIDITLCKIIYSELAIAIVINKLLKNKEFIEKNNDIVSQLPLIGKE